MSELLPMGYIKGHNLLTKATHIRWDMRIHNIELCIFQLNTLKSVPTILSIVFNGKHFKHQIDFNTLNISTEN